MDEPIVFISRSRIVEGKRADFALAFSQGVDLIASTKPRTAMFAAYLGETGTDVSVVHTFPDAAALALHFEGSDERTLSVTELIAPDGFEIYGRAPRALIDQLRREAERSGVSLAVWPEPIGGFLRSPT